MERASIRWRGFSGTLPRADPAPYPRPQGAGRLHMDLGRLPARSSYRSAQVVHAEARRRGGGRGWDQRRASFDNSEPVKESKTALDQQRASFETAATRPPQDEEEIFAPSIIYLILRSARPLRRRLAAAPRDEGARLEGPTIVVPAYHLRALRASACKNSSAPPARRQMRYPLPTRGGGVLMVVAAG